MDVILSDVKYLVRRDTEENWKNKNPILLNGEIGYVTSGTHAEMCKIGNGATVWKDLPFHKAIANGGNSDTVSDISTNTVSFTEASTRLNILSGENIPTLFGKIKKWFSDLKSLAFKDTISETDLNTTLSGKISSYDSHISNTTSNPHNITKSTIGLGNVEDKSSATIRSELTKANVTSALGYTPPEVDTDTTYEIGTETTPGITKLYINMGNNADGTMTQKAITEAINNHNHDERYTTVNIVRW